MRLSTQRIKELVAFAILAAIMISTQYALQTFMGIQLNGLFVAAITITYRFRALLSIYTYIMLYCIFFPTLWSVPYLYIWLPLWGSFMLAATLAERINLPNKARIPIYMLLCGLYGLSFGLLYAPFQAFITGWSFDMMKAWYLSGLILADIPHAINNLALGALILPLSRLLKKLNNQPSL